MSEPKFLGSEDFRAAALEAMTSDKIAPENVILRGSFDTEVKAAEETRGLNFTISTASVDRMGDTVAVDGWKLDRYQKNPVVLWAHDASMLPVAKATSVYIQGGKLKASTEFTPEGMSKFNDTVFAMYKGGFLSATSVGFAPIKYAFAEDANRKYGIDFLEQELLEFSAVPVPANAEALIEGKAAGIDVSLVLDWAEQTMAHDDERILRLADGILSKSKTDPALYAFGKKIVAANGDATITQKRLISIERTATQQRLAAKRKRELELIEIRSR
jgi:HK97 family phage prohead protease